MLAENFVLLVRFCVWRKLFWYGGRAATFICLGGALLHQVVFSVV